MYKFETSRTVEALHRMSMKLRPAARKALNSAVTEATKSAKGTKAWEDQSAPNGTRSTIHGIMASGSSDVGQVVAGGASHWLEWGTKGHGPVTAPFLVFQINGHWIRTRWVRGITEREFMRTAAKEGQQVLEYAIDFYVGKALGGSEV